MRPTRATKRNWRPHPGDGAFAFLAPETHGLVHRTDRAIYPTCCARHAAKAAKQEHIMLSPIGSCAFPQALGSSPLAQTVSLQNDTTVFAAYWQTTGQRMRRLVVSMLAAFAAKANTAAIALPECVTVTCAFCAPGA